MLAQDGHQFVAAEMALRQPVRQLLMPHQHMAVHLHVMRLGECDQGVRLREIEAAALGLHDGKFQRVFRCDEIEFARQQLCVGGVLAEDLDVDVDGGAEADASRPGEGAQRVGRRGGQGARQRGGGHGGDGERTHPHFQ